MNTSIIHIQIHNKRNMERKLPSDLQFDLNTSSYGRMATPVSF